jgi:hypothetical protein
LRDVFVSNWALSLLISDDDNALSAAISEVERILDNPDHNSECWKIFNARFGNSDVAKMALRKMLAKATVGSPDGVNNTSLGIRQTSDEDEKTEKFDADGKPWTHGTSTPPNPPAAFRVYQYVTINKSGRFLNILSKTNIGGYRATGMRSRVLQLLNELAHVLIDSKGKPLIEDDGPGSTQSSSANTEIIKQKCQKEIEALGD